ncbi:MAG: hypothetical protein MHMPM18_000426 [Marteilia pararefringens]
MGIQGKRTITDFVSEEVEDNPQSKAGKFDDGIQPKGGNRPDESDMWNVLDAMEFRIGDNALVNYNFEHQPEVKRRENCFRIDCEVPSKFRSSSKSYKKKANYDRGHLLPASDFVRHRHLYRQTFRYSNIFPHNSKLNQGVWRSAELLARNLVTTQRLEVLWVYSGLGFDSPIGPKEAQQACRECGECQSRQTAKFEDPTTHYKKRFLQSNKGDQRVSVPDFLFKIFYGLYDGNNYIFAFSIRNESVEFSPTILIENQIDIESLETACGLLFPSKLKDPRNLCMLKHFNCKVSE